MSKEKTELMVLDEETYYIEFNLQGTFKTKSKDKTSAIKKITGMINNLIKHHELISIEHGVNVASEDDIMNSMAYNSAAEMDDDEESFN